MKRQPKRPNIEATMQWVDSVTATPEGFSSGRWFQMMWPFMLAAFFAGVVFILLKIAIFEIRRSIYNRNRNLAYAGKKKWRKKSQPRWKVPHPLPPGFEEGLREQWDKVHDSLDEMLKFGEMLIELEDYVDNSFVFDDKGNIVSRFPGIKGFLKEHCPHIPYKTAMRYRILAMKSHVAKENGDLPEIRKNCKYIDTLTKRLDSSLGVEHIRLKYKKRREHLCRLNPNSASLDLRGQAHADLLRIHSSQRQLYTSALQELARKMSVS